DQGMDKILYFAAMIKRHKDFELVVEPELNILGYRYVPYWLQQALQQATSDQAGEVNACLDQITRLIQKAQRADGQTFVSRTRVDNHLYDDQVITVFRVVLANPLTTLEVLNSVLDEQLELAKHQDIQDILAEIKAILTA
ncbi:MAG: putative pyridoxal-dependent aspartate 1-decarboxylase, partial [Pseudomonadota bacterium]|nr:putative pyridoxal-dependent aspartate 1-decarboxylase [Pseudomonadota bacterium]